MADKNNKGNKKGLFFWRRFRRQISPPTCVYAGPEYFAKKQPSVEIEDENSGSENETVSDAPKKVYPGGFDPRVAMAVYAAPVSRPVTDRLVYGGPEYFLKKNDQSEDDFSESDLQDNNPSEPTENDSSEPTENDEKAEL